MKQTKPLPWEPGTWRYKKSAAQITYPSRDALEQVILTLKKLPPLVFPGELEQLQRQIAKAGRGEAFIIHGGDCVERFEDCNRKTITDKFKILLQMSTILTYGLRKPVVRIGRIAGQYFKPRSKETETVNGEEILTYRGDPVHSFLPKKAERLPNPARLEQAYYRAAATLNYIRAMIAGGFTDLHHPYNWNLEGIEGSDRWVSYKKILDNILDAIRFMESIGGTRPESLGSVDFFTSHEGLHLPYEESLSRKAPEDKSWYNAGAHMLWIGDRTRDPSGGHAEYFRGISNPIGVKLSHMASADDTVDLIRLLNPANLPGKVTLITRLGSSRVHQILPGLLKAVGRSGCSVTWTCDPMHGNTVTAGDHKTRNFDNILQELKDTYEVHSGMGSHLGGVHFELTGDHVTECTGGAVGLTEEDLSRNYQSWCDPRLNYAQSMEMAFLIARLMK